MKVVEGNLPDGDWITTGEASVIWSAVKGYEVAPERLRRWCKRDDHRMEGIGTWHAGGRWLIEKESLIRVLRQRAQAGLAALDEIEKEEGG
jgi:hypothetical protein